MPISMHFPDDKKDLEFFLDDLTEQMVRDLISISSNLQNEPYRHSKMLPISFSSPRSHVILFIPQERRFARMNISIMSQLDQMGHRVDDLEREVHSLVAQASSKANRKDAASSSHRSAPQSLPITSATSSAVEILKKRRSLGSREKSFGSQL